MNLAVITAIDEYSLVIIILPIAFSFSQIADPPEATSLIIFNFGSPERSRNDVRGAKPISISPKCQASC